MSGCIVFSESAGWCKAGWAYRAALAGICETLAENRGAEALLHELMDQAGPAHTVQNIEVAAWNEKKRGDFCRATIQACRILRARGSKDWKDPSFFPEFSKALEELEAFASAPEHAKTG